MAVGIKERMMKRCTYNIIKKCPGLLRDMPEAERVGRESESERARE
jgi:hypothetical protein